MTDSSEERLDKLVAGLIGKTRQGNVDWNQVEDDEISFHAVLDSGGVVITPTYDNSFKLFVLDSRGHEVASGDDRGGTPYVRRLPELYELARDASGGGAIDDLLDELDD